MRSPSHHSVLGRLVAAALAAALGSGCATYLVPAASDDFLASPFRVLPREVAPVVSAATKPRHASGVVLASTRTGRSAGDLPLEKLTLPADNQTDSLQPATLVEGALRLRGARFGTDGQVGSLYEYMRREHALVPARAARPGDVLFFAVEGPACADHTGVVEAVDDIGRITFREVRGGQVRTSYVHPGDPTLRRWSDGRVINSFLRPRRTDDPPAAKYFAGEMLCAVARVRR